MRENFGLDKLVEHGAEKIPDPETTKVIDPKYRSLDQLVQKTQGQLNRKLAVVGALAMPPLVVPSEVIEAFQEKKCALNEEVLELQNSIIKLKAERKLSRNT